MRCRCRWSFSGEIAHAAAGVRAAVNRVDDDNLARRTTLELALLRQHSQTGGTQHRKRRIVGHDIEPVLAVPHARRAEIGHSGQRCRDRIGNLVQQA